MVLNPEQSAYQHILEAARSRVIELEAKCPHAFAPESGFCVICREHFGWYCPDNPNRDFPICQLQWNGQGDDECVYCGQPDERK